MDPVIASLILFAGLILVAAAGTSAALAGSPRTSRAPTTLDSRELPYDPAVAAAVFCPQKEELADVRLGVDRTGSPAALTVIQCEHFGDGAVSCEMECLGAPVAA